MYGPPRETEFFDGKSRVKILTKFFLRKHFSFYLFVTARSKYGGLHQKNQKLVFLRKCVFFGFFYIFIQISFSVIEFGKAWF